MKDAWQPNAGPGIDPESEILSRTLERQWGDVNMLYV